MTDREKIFWLIGVLKIGATTDLVTVESYFQKFGLSLNTHLEVYSSCLTDLTQALTNSTINNESTALNLASTNS